MKLFKCPNCSDKYEQLPDLLSHIEDEHPDSIPKDQTVSQYYYMVRTGKTHGNCVICKRETKWNDSTEKYHRLCGRSECKEASRELFKNRMIGKYGKITLLKDPEHQKKMLANRSISGKYRWSDGKEIQYTGSYELDFLKFLDLFMGFSSDDIMAPSPHTYYYKYKGEEKFYIPDFFIMSLNMEIEVKDGGSNPNMHPKHQAVDRVKEKLKDEVLVSQRDYSYIKVVDKKYDNFIDALIKMKEHVRSNGEYSQVFDIGDGKGVFSKPIMESYLADGDDLDEGFVIEMVESIDSIDLLEEILEVTDLTERVECIIENKINFLKVDTDDLLYKIKSTDDSLQLDTSHAIDEYLTEKGLMKNGQRRPGISVLHLQNVFLDVVESLLNGDGYEHIKENYLDKDFRKALKNFDNPTMYEVYQRDCNAMAYYLRLLADSFEGDKVDIYDLSDYTDQLVAEATFRVEGQESYPVYVVLTHTGTVLSNAIKMVTKEPYSHASISFDEGLEEMYSFGRKYKDNPLIGTFVSENIKSGLYADVSNTATYSLYVTFVNKEQLEAMRKRLSQFQEGGTKFKYSFMGLINFKLGKESDSTDAFFCSQFVDHILSAGKQFFDRHSSMVQPNDFAKHKDFYFVSKGKLKDYNESRVLKRVNEISKKAKMNNYKKKDKVVYIGLTPELSKKKRVSIYPEGNFRYALLDTSLSKLEKTLLNNNLTGTVTHYTVVPLSKIKHKESGVADTVMVELPLDIKVTNLNTL